MDTQPTHAGQFVRDIRTGKLGITTDAPKARTPRIGVMFAGANYPTLSQVRDLERVTVTVA